MKTFEIYPIGSIKQLENRTVLNIFKEYRDGLDGLKEGMGILLLLWFDRSDTPEKKKDIESPSKGKS